MLKKTLIAAATAVALAGTALTAVAPAAAAPAGTIDISWQGGWNGQGQWNGQGDWKGGKHGGHKQWNPRRACEPIIRWKQVGYRYHRRWQPIVVGWNCHGGHGGHKGGNGHNYNGNNNWKWN